MTRLVLDTNVVLDWLVFRDRGVAHLVRAIDERRATVLTNAACEAELARVLAYDSLALDATRRQEMFTTYCRVTTRYAGASRPDALPRCADADDQKFLELARDAAAAYLVTKDKSLLTLARTRYRLAGFRIVTPAGLQLEPAAPSAMRIRQD
jgi:putative PIN family toxin of toxin-antitoxin system